MAFNKKTYQQHEIGRVLTTSGTPSSAAMRKSLLGQISKAETHLKETAPFKLNNEFAGMVLTSTGQILSKNMLLQAAGGLTLLNAFKPNLLPGFLKGGLGTAVSGLGLVGLGNTIGQLAGNPLAGGTLGGIAGYGLGASIGAIGGPIGAIAGLIGGFFGGGSARRRRNREKARIRNAMRQIIDQADFQLQQIGLSKLAIQNQLKQLTDQKNLNMEIIANNVADVKRVSSVTDQSIRELTEREVATQRSIFSTQGGDQRRNASQWFIEGRTKEMGYREMQENRFQTNTMLFRENAKRRQLSIQYDYLNTELGYSTQQLGIQAESISNRLKYDLDQFGSQVGLDNRSVMRSKNLQSLGNMIASYGSSNLFDMRAALAQLTGGRR